MAEYFDRSGRAIALQDWARLWADPDYRILCKTDVSDRLRLVTVWEGFWPYAIVETPRRIFHTAAIHRRERERDTFVEILAWYDTEAVAHAGHLNHLACAREGHVFYKSRTCQRCGFVG